MHPPSADAALGGLLPRRLWAKADEVALSILSAQSKNPTQPGRDSAEEIVFLKPWEYNLRKRRNFYAH
jgi:hypothetical protein